MKFSKITLKSVGMITEFFRDSPTLSDYSAITKYMWRNFYKTEYAVFDDTLIIKDRYGEKHFAFMFPVGKNPWGAVDELANLSKTENFPLELSCIPNDYLAEFKRRYPFVKVSVNRDWSDYIYLAEDFRTFQGKKFSGQRNHVNKFKRLYPEYRYEKITRQNIGLAEVCFKEYRKEVKKTSSLAKQENAHVEELFKHFFSFSEIRGGMIIIGGKCAGFTFTEKVGETLIIHVEKALRDYEGIAPTLAGETAKILGQDCKYLNREDDAGDKGLRISKTQFQPIDVAAKNFLRIRKGGFNVYELPHLKSGAVELLKITLKDKDDYYRLYTDEELNRYWGYDYKNDIKNPTPLAFYRMQQRDFKNKSCFCFKITANGNPKMLGEVCLYDLDCYGGAEIGVRLFKENFGKGYAKTAVKLVKRWAEKSLKLVNVHAKCFKENVRSIELLKRVGFKHQSENDEFYFFGG